MAVGIVFVSPCLLLLTVCNCHCWDVCIVSFACVFLLFGCVLLVGCKFCCLALRIFVGWPCVLLLVGSVYCWLTVCMFLVDCILLLVFCVYFFGLPAYCCLLACVLLFVFSA